MINTINTLELIQYKTEKAFDILSESVLNLEAEIGCEDGIITESAADSISNFFKKIYETIGKIINQIKESITKLFQKEVVEKEVEEIQEVIKEEPSFENVELKMKDYAKLRKLNKEIRFEIVGAKSLEKLEKKMKTYRKQRNTLLVGGTLVGTTVGLVFRHILKGKNAIIEEGKQQYEETEKHAKNIEKMLTALNKGGKIDPNSAATSETEEDKKIKIDLSKRSISALMEVASNTLTDSIDEVKEGWKAVTSEKNIFKRTIKAVKYGKQVVKNIKTTGTRQKHDASTRGAEISDEIEELKNQPQTPETKKKIKELEDELKGLSTKIGILSK